MKSIFATRRSVLGIAGSLAALGLVGCNSQPASDGAASGTAEDTTIKVGATPTPHAEVLNAVKDELAREGYTLEVVEYNDYVLPNTALEDGELDANYFQHITYLNDFNSQNGTHLASAADVHFEPFGLYAGKTASLDDLAEGAVVAVPNDTTNEARALLLLQQEGLIKLKDGVGLEATVLDIEENPLDLDIQEVEAAQLPRVLPDVDLAAINGNYALGAGLSVDDALATESDEGEAAKAYVNVIAVREGEENEPKIQALVKAVTSQTAKAFIDKAYSGSVVPLF